MVTEELKNAFWDAVSDCLVRFHGFTRAEANARTFARHSEVGSEPGRAFEPELIYHDEPFYIASRLAGHDLDLEPHLVAYHAILTRRLGHVPGVAVAGVPASSPGLAGGAW
ncbi:MAG TPA: hypothetical protein VFY65_18190 [Longimicrobium sp.]|nr:hypothetical protein [Longimicrobium sp.]